MKFLPRLLFLTAILFVVLGFCQQESGNTSVPEHGLTSIELIRKDAGLAPVGSQDLPLPAECRLSNGQIETDGKSMPVYERALLHKYNELMTRTNAAHRNRSPERMAMKGLWIRSTGDLQAEDPSRSRAT
jgi:hypothetical protein